MTRPEFPRATLELGAQHCQARCAACHGARGEGGPHWRDKAPGSAPPLNGSGAEWLLPLTEMKRIIREGRQRDDHANAMPGFGASLAQDKTLIP